MRSIILALAVAVALVAAQTNSPLTMASFINDNYVLNYALTLENFEAELYRRANASFTPASYTAAGFNASVAYYVQTLTMQESIHSAAINATLISRGWPPVQPCQYTFPPGIFTDVRAFLNFTATVEQVGVSAYDGAVPYVSDPALLQFAATVATVEARHSASLYQIGGLNFSPNAFEPALAPADVVRTVAQYLGNCPSSVFATAYNGTVTSNSSALPLPQLANVTRQLNSSFATQNAPVVNITSDAKLNDDRVLNYALTALQFVDAFLNFSLVGNSTTPPPVNASSLAAAGYSPNVLPGLMTILNQNTAQVAAVRMVITSRGQTPVEPCIYTFPSNVTSVATFWPLAVTFENVSVQAFDGGIRAITDTSVALMAAMIATVEGRHSAFLNGASNISSPFPSPYDGTLTPPQTVNLLLPFIVTCPTTNVEAISGATITSLNATLPSYINYFNQQGQSLPNIVAATPVVNPATPLPSTTSSSSTTNSGSSTTSSSSTTVAGSGSSTTSTTVTRSSTTTSATRANNWAPTVTISLFVIAALMMFV